MQIGFGASEPPGRMRRSATMPIAARILPVQSDGNNALPGQGLNVVDRCMDPTWNGLERVNCQRQAQRSASLRVGVVLAAPTASSWVASMAA